MISKTIDSPKITNDTQKNQTLNKEVNEVIKDENIIQNKKQQKNKYTSKQNDTSQNVKKRRRNQQQDNNTHNEVVRKRKKENDLQDFVVEDEDEVMPSINQDEEQNQIDPEQVREYQQQVNDHE